MKKVQSKNYKIKDPGFESQSFAIFREILKKILFYYYR